MSVLENFKNIPRSPYGGATGLKCNFFSSNLQRSPWRKKKEGGLSPPQRATGPYRPPKGRQASGPARGASRPSCGRQGGPVAPPTRGRPGCPPYKSPSPPLPSSFEPENSTKNPEKKRGVRRRKAAKPCRIQHL